MCYKNETLKPMMNDEKFFDFFPQSGHPLIMSYDCINREILVKEDTNQIVFGDIIKRKEIYSICTLRQQFDALISLEIELFNKYGAYNIGVNLEPGTDKGGIPFRIDIKHEDRELIIDQLIFDVLEKKYVADSPLMTLQQYSIYQSQYNRNGQTEKERIDSVRKCISNGLEKQKRIMNNPELRNQITELGFVPDEYLKYHGQVSTPFTHGEKQIIHKKRKARWDMIYYNADTKLITGKQYDRSFSKNNNYSHAAFVNLFNIYDQYIDNLYMHPAENSKSYFYQSLDFYLLESYKRLDFIYKLAVRLDELHFPHIEKSNLFVRRFLSEVCIVLDQNGSLKFGNWIKYYRPMLMLELAWLQKLPEEPVDVFKWQKFYFIRAKVYELFNYHFHFASNDYDEISDFIKTHYNILGYHDPNKIWIQADKKRKCERDARIIKALEINEALFGASDKRKPVPWTSPDTV